MPSTAVAGWAAANWAACASPMVALRGARGRREKPPGARGAAGSTSMPRAVDVASAVESPTSTKVVMLSGCGGT